jgi:hypothetical protein
MAGSVSGVEDLIRASQAGFAAVRPRERLIHSEASAARDGLLAAVPLHSLNALRPDVLTFLIVANGWKCKPPVALKYCEAAATGRPFSPGGGETTYCIERSGNIVDSEKTVCFREVPIPALACSRARAPDLETAAPPKTGRSAAVPPSYGGPGAGRSDTRALRRHPGSR